MQVRCLHELGTTQMLTPLILTAALEVTSIIIPFTEEEAKAPVVKSPARGHRSEFEPGRLSRCRQRIAVVVWGNPFWR